MKPLPKWFLIPPAAAALVVLGSLTQGGGAQPRAANAKPAPANARTTVAAPVATTAEERTAADEPAASDGAAAAPASADTATPAAAAARRDAPSGPKAPDFGQMLTALVAVLGLGVAGVYVLRQLRGPARPTGDGKLMTLRQSLRLSPRHTLHAIEFDDRIVLVGETERGLALVDGGKLPDRAADEAAVLARAAAAAAAAADDDDDDGAVPKNLIIPRPDRPLPARAVRAPSIRTPATNAAATSAAAPALADFRNLLQKVGRS
jgi:flagellar biogenesis protein FliO